MRTRTLLVLLAAAIVLLGAACGDDSTSAKSSAPTRTIDVDMHDIGFTPDRVSVRAGETIRFVFHNTGEAEHDAYLGDEDAQMAHEQEMNGSMGGMHHGDSDSVTVAAGKAGSLTHTFAAGEDTLIGCHEPGHFAAGMKITIDVT